MISLVEFGILWTPLIVWAVCQTQINKLEKRIEELESLKGNGGREANNAP